LRKLLQDAVDAALQLVYVLRQGNLISFPVSGLLQPFEGELLIHDVPRVCLLC